MERMDSYRAAQKRDILLDLKYRASYLTILNRAYAKMLAEQGDITSEDYQILDEGLKKIDGTVTAEMANPEKGDVFFLYEQALYDAIGKEAACKLHTGRSRNDMYFSMWRMSVRDACRQMIEEILKLQKLLERTAEKNLTTIIPYYTYGQPSQPGTWGHYLMSVHEMLEGDVRRLKAAYENVNRSPMGSAAGIGSSFRIDKARLQELLGFDSVIENTMTANSAEDYYLEVISAMAVVSTTLSRVSNDLLYFAGTDCGILNCDMSLCGGSSIMPQKKNAEAVGMLRAHTVTMSGYLMSALTAAGTGSLFPVMETYAYYADFWKNVDSLIENLRVTGLIIERSEINKERAEACARDGFTAATAMAEQLVHEEQKPFELVHHVVGGMIYTLMDENRLSIENMTPELLKTSAVKALGYPIERTQEEIDRMLDPLESLKAKITGGTPKPEDTLKLIEAGKKVRMENEAWLEKAEAHIQKGYDQL